MEQLPRNNEPLQWFTPEPLKSFWELRADEALIGCLRIPDDAYPEISLLGGRWQFVCPSRELLEIRLADQTVVGECQLRNGIPFGRWQGGVLDLGESGRYKWMVTRYWTGNQWEWETSSANRLMRFDNPWMVNLRPKGKIISFDPVFDDPKWPLLLAAGWFMALAAAMSVEVPAGWGPDWTKTIRSRTDLT